MANANTWSALQTFGNASTSQISSTDSAYFATSTGNVGIGTSDLLYKLDVNGAGRISSYLDASYFVATTTTATSTFAGGLTVGTSQLVVQQSTGNVGIGTSSPQFKLDVAGNIGAAGLCLNGSCVTSWSELTANFENNNLQINGALSIKPEQVFALDADGYLVMGKIDAEAVKTKSLSMDNIGAEGAKMIGSASIEIGSSSATIINQDIATSSKVFITWRDNLAGASWWICRQVSQKSFSVCLDKNAATSMPFDYWIIGVKENAGDNGQVAGETEAPIETDPPADASTTPEVIISATSTPPTDETDPPAGQDLPADDLTPPEEITPSDNPEPEVIPEVLPEPEPVLDPVLEPAAAPVE